MFSQTLPVLPPKPISSKTINVPVTKKAIPVKKKVAEKSSNQKTDITLSPVYAAPVISQQSPKTQIYKFISNAPGELFIDGESKGILEPEVPIKIKLGKGEYFILIKSRENDNDRYSEVLFVTETGNERIHELDLQAVIDKRIAKLQAEGEARQKAEEDLRQLTKKEQAEIAKKKAAEKKKKTVLTQLNNDGTIKWLTWDEMTALNEQNPNKILIDFYVTWCKWCLMMNENTYRDPFIVHYLSHNFYCVRFNVEGKDDIVFQDHTYKWVASSSTGYHELAAYFMQNKMSYPTTTFLTPDYKLINNLQGYITSEKIEPLLIYMGEDHWDNKNETYEQFKADYKRPEE